VSADNNAFVIINSKSWHVKVYAHYWQADVDAAIAALKDLKTGLESKQKVCSATLPEPARVTVACPTQDGGFLYVMSTFIFLRCWICKGCPVTACLSLV